jgi:hypothetical protein
MPRFGAVTKGGAKVSRQYTGVPNATKIQKASPAGPTPPNTLGTPRNAPSRKVAR